MAPDKSHHQMLLCSYLIFHWHLSNRISRCHHLIDARSTNFAVDVASTCIKPWNWCSDVTSLPASLLFSSVYIISNLEFDSGRGIICQHKISIKILLSISQACGRGDIVWISPIGTYVQINFIGTYVRIRQRQRPSLWISGSVLEWPLFTQDQVHVRCVISGIAALRQ